MAMIALTISSCSNTQGLNYSKSMNKGATNVTVSDGEKPTPKLISPPIEQNKSSLNYNEYNIKIDVNPETRKVTGVQKVTYTNKNITPINTVYFNTYLNAFSYNAKMKPYLQGLENNIFGDKDKDYGYMDIIDISVNNETSDFKLNETVLSVSLDEPLSKDDDVEISIKFEAYIPKINHRTGANDKAMWLGNFLPIVAANDKNIWHTEPYYPVGNPFYSNISNYTIKVTTPIGYTTIGTGEETTTEVDGNNQTIITAKMARDFAFAIGKDYTVKSLATESGIYVNLYTYTDITNGDKILEWATKSLDYYGQLLGKYPYPSIDIIEVGLFSPICNGYPQAIFVDTGLIKSHDIYDSLTGEIGKQWFGNSVGNNNVEEAWLSDGIVVYLNEKMLINNYKKLQEYMANEYNKLSGIISAQYNGALNNSLAEYNSWEEYNNVQVIRAKLMMFALNKKMGESKFNEFIKLYYGKYSFSMVDKNDFISTAEEVSGENLKSFFDSWIIQKELPNLY